MSSLFCGLIENSLSEIERRDPQYLARFPLTFPRAESRADRYHEHPVLNKYENDVLQKAVNGAEAYLTQRGLPLREPQQADDPASCVIFDALLDAFAAAEGLLPIQPSPPPARPTEQVVTTEYDDRRTPGGRRYVIRRQGDQPLLIVNALGIPLHMWNKLLADASHDFRVIAVENRCGDLFAGGMQSDAALTQHAEDISDVLDHERLESFHVLGWCNGGRIAIDLVTRCSHKVLSLTLLSPTLRGAEKHSQLGSPFEDRLEQIFTTVKKSPALATPLVKMISRFTQAPDWDGLATDPVGRAKALFALPAQETAAAFLMPMSTPPFLLNYAHRTAADEAYSMSTTLRALAASGIPVLLITGSHDTMVSNQATCAALCNAGVRPIHAEVSGAGHYIQDLQYPYFLWLLKGFLRQHKVSGDSLRVRINDPDGTTSLH
ncbi:MAG TPA: alpha/beta hydrolase [Candidatus Angelobacter sp.]